MKSCLLLVIFGLAAATSSIFRNGQHLLHFDGSIQSTIGIPSGFSISRIQSDVILQIHDNSAMLMLKNIHVHSDSFEREVYNHKNMELSTIALTEEQEKLLTLPAQFTYKDGKVSLLRFDKNDETWSENIKRAIMNMLQLQHNSILDTGRETEDLSYLIEEETIEGTCEVIYNRVSQGSAELVTKSVDFSNCSNIPAVNHCAPRISQCGQTNDTKPTQQQSLYSYRLENGMLKKVEVRSVYSVMHGNDAILTTSVKNSLYFVESGVIEEKIEVDGKENQNLTYSMFFDSAVDTFYRSGEYKNGAPFKSYTTKVEEIKEMFTHGYKDVLNNTEKISHMVRLLRMCIEEELHQVFSESDIKVERLYILLQSLATAGTRTTIEKLLNLIRGAKISPLQTSLLFKLIQGTNYPSIDIGKLVLDFVQKESKISQTVEQSAWLAFGSIIHGAIISSEQGNNENSAEWKKKYNTLLFKQFEGSHTTYRKILFLKTIGNAGLDISIHHLRKVIKNMDEEVPVRLEAIDALRTLKDSVPHKIHSILMPVYKNYLNQPEVRMASLLQIVRSHPTLSILYQLVRHMEKESNEQMATFTHRVLSGYAESTIPCYRSIASHLKALLRMSSYRPTKKIRSSFYHLPFYSSQVSLSGINIDLVNLYKKNSLLPKEVSASIDLLSAGSWSKNLIQLGLSQHDQELPLQDYFRGVFDVKDQRKSTYFTNRTIAPYAQLYIRYMDMDYAFISLDLPSLLNSTNDLIINSFSSIIETSEVNLLMQLNEYSSKMPTTIGLPLISSHRLPGTTSVKFSSDRKCQVALLCRWTEKFAELGFAFSAANSVQMSVWSPFFHQGVETSQKISSQIKCKLHQNRTRSEPGHWGLTWIAPEHGEPLFRLSSLQFVFNTNNSANDTRNKTPLIASSSSDISVVNKQVTIGDLHIQLNWTGSATIRDLLLLNQHLQVGYETSFRNFQIIPFVNYAKGVRSFPTVNRLFGDDMTTNIDTQLLMNSTSPFFFDDASEEIAPKINFVCSSHDQHTYVLSFWFQHNLERGTVVISSSMKRIEKLPERRHEEILYNFISLNMLPKYISSLEELNNMNRQSVESLNTLTWGSADEQTISFGVRLMQNNDQVEITKLISEDITMSQTYRLLKTASTLNQLELKVFESSSNMKRILNKLADICKWSSIFESDSQETETNPESDLHITVTADPKTRESFNIRMDYDGERLTLRKYNIIKLSLPSLVNPLLRSNPLLEAQCRIRGQVLETFDQTSVPFTLSTCYSVLSRDCSEKKPYTILVKKMDDESDNKMLKIISGENVYTMEGKEDTVIVKKMSSTQSRSLFNPEFESTWKWHNTGFQRLGRYVRFDSSGYSVLFDGRNVSVYLNRALAAGQCGLCGLFDGESHNDLMTSDYKVTRDVHDFSISYLRIDEECQSELEKIHRLKAPSMSKPIQKDLDTRTLIMGYHHRMCFSQSPVQDCPRGEIVLRTERTKVRFTCFPINENTQKMKSQAIEGTLDLSGHEVTYVDYVELPVVCSHE